MAAPLLASLTADWLRRGWTVDDLATFRMEDPPAPAPTPPPVADPPAPATFTQADLDRIAAREKAEGRTAAEKAMAESLGMTLDEAKALIAKQKQADEAQLSEAQKREKAAEEREAKAAEREAAAAAKERQASLTTALVAEGVKADRRDAAMRLVDAPADADDAAIAEAVKACKTAYPEFFGTADPAPPTPNRPAPPRPPAPSSNPGGGNPKPRPPEDTFGAAMERGRNAAEKPRALIEPGKPLPANA